MQKIELTLVCTQAVCIQLRKARNELDIVILGVCMNDIDYIESNIQYSIANNNSVNIVDIVESADTVDTGFLAAGKNHNTKVAGL